MPPSLNLPLSLLGVLGCLRPYFTAPTFATFCGLVAGLAGQVRRRTVVGMLLGACLQRAWPHDRAHYFFSRARWQVDELGIAVARLVVGVLAGPGAEVTIALDDSVFVRSGKKVHGAGWQHDGSARNLQKLSYGNCFVTVGIVVRLPFCSRAWCLPVLARLHLPGKGAGEARNRTRLAVERTVPFGMLVHTLIVLWYARHGYDQADIDARRADQPWYDDKTESAFEDMLIKLRRTLIAARFSPATPGQPTSDEIRSVTAAWAAAAA